MRWCCRDATTWRLEASARTTARQESAEYPYASRQAPEQLAGELAAQSDEERLQELARQLVWLSNVVWRKNQWAQWSLIAAAVAVMLIVAAHLIHQVVGYSIFDLGLDKRK
jgi:hypothetical protein